MSVADPKRTSGEQDPSTKTRRRLLDKFKGPDRVASLSQAAGTVGGTAAGVVAAGTLASAAGASTLLGSSTLAGVLGGIFVTSTPIGWVLGAAAAGGALGLAVVKLARSGGRNEERRDNIVAHLKQQADEAASVTAASEASVWRDRLEQSVRIGAIDAAAAGRLRAAVIQGRLSTEKALALIDGVLQDRV
ncbi:hypothetical protein [Sphaerotilus mobilis]|uniref:Uncharacterized protein n=1 Tax=Sphaerotilus mobilis TaxID=47994 RepID=A0A4Q7LTD8_9BURK|nr:hypothetical protein [Sphaerotilus mobilis]RZS57954.1 hypothetical protein EV685_0228 [Sphaerotilus mobilis]